MPGHTPGLWVAPIPSGLVRGPSKVHPGTESSVAQAQAHGNGSQELAANTKLITAAPDMLKDLKQAKQNIEQLCDTTNCLSKKLGLGRKVRFEDFADKVLAAIAKVED